MSQWGNPTTPDNRWQPYGSAEAVTQPLPAVGHVGHQTATAWADRESADTTVVLGGSAAAHRSASRARWADVAKGVCILLVVGWHVIMKHYLQLDWNIPAPIVGAWGAFGEQFLPLRMPLFFAISGLFAANAVHRSWRVVRRSKVARFYYLYALWFVVHTTVLAIVPSFDTLHAENALDVLEQLTITPTNLWYLAALAIYFTIAKVTRRLPVAAVLVPALALSIVASAGLLADPGNRGQLFQNLFFFLAGLRLRPTMERLAAEANWRRLVLAGGAFMVVVPAVRLAGAQQWYGVWPAVSALGVVVGVTAAVRACQWPRLAEPLARLGRQTLPIYVMHMPLLALLHWVLRGPLSSLGTAGQLVLAVFLPVVLTALLVWLCLWLHRVLNSRAGWLFDLPGQRAGRRADSARDSAVAMSTSSTSG